MTDDDNLSEIQIGWFGDSTVGKTYLTRRYIKDPTLKEFFFSTSELSLSISNTLR